MEIAVTTRLAFGTVKRSSIITSTRERTKLDRSFVHPPSRILIRISFSSSSLLKPLDTSFVVKASWPANPQSRVFKWNVSCLPDDCDLGSADKASSCQFRPRSTPVHRVLDSLNKDVSPTLIALLLTIVLASDGNGTDLPQTALFGPTTTTLV